MSRHFPASTHEQIATRLEQTLLWCAQRPIYLSPPPDLSYDENAPDPWRSPLLRPHQLSGDTTLEDLPSRQRMEAVEESCRRRADWLNANPHPQDMRWRGTLLADYRDITTLCGAAEVESGKFYDVSDTPAWDTWIGLFELPYRSWTPTILLYWAPAVMMPLLGDSIDVMVLGHHGFVLDLELERFINERFSQRGLPPIDWMTEPEIKEHSSYTW